MNATVTFKKIIQDSQEIGSGGDWMISLIFFDLEIG
jgi:hypothetical protein